MVIRVAKCLAGGTPQKRRTVSEFFFELFTSWSADILLFVVVLLLLPANIMIIIALCVDDITHISERLPEDRTNCWTHQLSVRELVKLLLRSLLCCCCSGINPTCTVGRQRTERNRQVGSCAPQLLLAAMTKALYSDRWRILLRCSQASILTASSAVLFPAVLS